MTFYHFVEIKFADPVSSMALTDRYLVCGSILGRLVLSQLPEKKNTVLSEFSMENITGSVFENEEAFNVSIGDDEVVRYKINYYEQQLATENFHQKNYEDELFHKTKCEGCYTILAKTHFIMVHLPIAEGNSVDTCNINITVKNIANYTSQDLVIEMTNYSIPFDFDGRHFLWVEFDKDNMRSISIYNFETKTTIKHKVNKEFGHISFAKLMSSSKVLIVRLQNIVEIRNLNDFKITKTFVNIGEEVIAIDFYHNLTKIILNDHDNLNLGLNSANNNLVLLNNAGHKTMNEPQYSKLLEEKGASVKRETAVLQINEELTLNEDNLTIAVLDIDGNVNVWENCNVSTKFNLYNVKEISEEHKTKQFFSMGYQYQMRITSNYYAISSDHGVYIFKKEI